MLHHSRMKSPISFLARVVLLASTAVVMAGEPWNERALSAGGQDDSPAAEQGSPTPPTELLGKAKPKNATVAGREKPADTGEGPPADSLSGEQPVGFYQELVVSQKSNYRIQGLESSNSLKYGVLSSLLIEDRSDGGKTVHQKVEGTKLIAADEPAQDIFKGLLKNLEGTTFRLTFNPQREVTKWGGGRDSVQATAGGDGLSGASLQLASLIDRDGWKELDQLSLFRPPAKSLRTNAKWKRTATHSWGALGSWTGDVTYGFAGRQEGLDRFKYVLNLKYSPPKKGGRILGLSISNPQFNHQEAGGVIYFDPRQRRVSGIEERFHVKGEMTIGPLLGQDIAVGLDEDQTFSIRILDSNPWYK